MKNPKNFFKSKTILITGGTGSFGSFFVREILNYLPEKIIIYSRDEDKQYSMQHELKAYKQRLRFVIGDIRDKSSLLKAMKEHVDILIHAAAMKQIPSTEYNISEAVRTNILGAQNITEACLETNVDKAIAISTDKAVEPINVMGMTKGLQERIFVLANKYRNGARTKFAVVRYGNVINSRGSVIPLFKKQIALGGPITLTDPTMTRFILTLEQGKKLVMSALGSMVGGEIFVPKIKPIRIIDLAEVMVEKLKPTNGSIVRVGIRPGEKLHEVLISEQESLYTVDKKTHYIVLPQIDLEEIGHTYLIKPVKKKVFSYSSDNGSYLTKKEIYEVLKKDRAL